MPIDDANEKVVLEVRDVRVSRHKDIHPEDSDAPIDIGLSSEEEAEGLEENPAVARKYHQTPAPPGPPPSTTATTSTTTSTDPQMATVQVPVAALQQVQQILGQIISGEAPPGGFPVPPPQQQQQQDPEGAPFSLPKPKRGEKNCTFCKRVFWSTDTLRVHMKTHTGEQKNICPNPGCGRKLSSKRSLETHLTTCQKEKTYFCKHKDCDKLFATRDALAAHTKTHRKLSKNSGFCPGCKKGGFTKQKSIDDHYRYCDANPNKVGPFPCLVPGCRRGPSKPFRRTRNLNAHMKAEHGFDPKHV